ncbi:MAG: RICIN domain-containing protein, partial [Marinoscillum sp.]
YIEPTGGGYYRLVSKNSGRVLDVDACSSADGQNVQQWEWLGGDCQQWKLEPVSPNEVPTGSYRITSKNSNKVLDVSGCSTSVGANVQQWPWNGANCQRWSINATADGYYEIISNASGLGLDVDGCSSVNGRNVQVWTGTSADCQKWGFEEVEPGYYKILSKNGLKVLDVSECATTDGANIQQWQWIGGDCQRWALEGVSQSQRIVTSILPNDEMNIQVYPNPVSDLLYLTINPADKGEAEVRLISSAGQEVYRANLTIERGANQIQIKIDDLSPGIYLLELTSDQLNQRERIIKK